MKDHWLFRVVCFSVFLAFCVVLLGAYTRLHEAGLGCPDWPGCYGHWVVPAGTIEAPKAWAEMVHRYVAGLLAMCVLFILIRSLACRVRYRLPIGLPIFISLLVIVQASLGRWTVTLKLLPPIVMFHLLGGMTLFVLLALLALRLGHFFGSVAQKDCRAFRRWALLGLVLLIVQIMLGGWTSANYASIVCTDFPYCHGQLIPTMNFQHAFSWMDKLGVNYQGGVLDESTRVTIQMMHRFGALVVFLYWLSFCLLLLGTSRSKVLLRFSLVILLLLFVQVALGIMNLVMVLPLHVALTHNAVAALLLVTVVALNYALYPRKQGALNAH